MKGKSSLRKTYGQDGGGDDEGSAYVWGAAAAEDAGKGKGGGWGKGAAGGEDEWGAGGKGKDPWGPMAGKGGKAWGKMEAMMEMWGMGGWGKGGDPWGMMGGDEWGGKGKKGKGKSWEEKAPPSKYEGLREATKTALEPIAHLETKWGPEDLYTHMVSYIEKGADTFAKDERLQQKGSPVQAQAIIEEFVETVMASIAQKCGDKAWFPEANFTAPLVLVAELIFKNGKVFARMLAPMLSKYVEDSIFRYREEERIQKAIWETVENSGVSEKYYKKCCQHLVRSYDDVHIGAPFGGTIAATAELGLLQDFVKGWMSEFVSRSWDVLENGVGGQEEQVNFVTNLFQTLCHPERLCLPHDLVASLDTPPPATWPYVAETAMNIYAEMAVAQANKQFKKKNPWH